MLADMVNDLTCAMQSAWIEWKHGEGVDAGMRWIENTLCGPGLIPDEQDPYGTESQAWFDKHRAEPFPECACGRPSNIRVADKGICSHAHFKQAQNEPAR